MAVKSIATVTVTPDFLRSAYELPEQYSRNLVETLRLLMGDPGEASRRSEPLSSKTDLVHSIRASDSIRILISGESDAKLLFVGSDDAARQFVERMGTGATAFAEVPIAFQLHIDFWQAEGVGSFESPSCGAPVSADDLAGLLRDGHRYLPLSHLLLSRGPEAGAIELSFREIESQLDDPLPEQARMSTAWWANDRSHAHAYSWLAIGWETTALDVQEESVTFVRKRGAGRVADAVPIS